MGRSFATGDAEKIIPYSKTEPYQPDTTSYDYDSLLGEAGTYNAEVSAIRDLIKKYLKAGETIPEPGTSGDLIEIP